MASGGEDAGVLAVGGAVAARRNSYTYDGFDRTATAAGRNWLPKVRRLLS